VNKFKARAEWPLSLVKVPELASAKTVPISTPEFDSHPLLAKFAELLIDSGTVGFCVRVHTFKDQWEYIE
jgi:hypothetical protein